MFHMYDKFFYKCDVTCSLPPPLCHKLSHLLGPPPLSSVTYFMDGPLYQIITCRVVHAVQLINSVSLHIFLFTKITLV